MRGMKAWKIAVVVALAFTAAVAMILAGLAGTFSSTVRSVTSSVRSGSEQSLAAYAGVVEKHADAVCADMQALGDHPFFARSAGSGSAGDFLNPKVSWDAMPGTDASLGIVHPAPLSLDPALRARIAGWKKDDWWELGRKEDLSGLDFSWMAELRGFDHWDLMAEGPLATFTDDEESHWVEAPLPDYLELRDWSRLRLLQGAATGRMEDAVEDVRHLARVMHRSSSPVGPAVALNVLLLERQAYDAIDPESPLRKGWAPFEKADLERMGRVTKFLLNYNAAALPSALVTRIRACTPAAIAGCTADIREAETLAMLRGLLSSDAPERYERFETRLPAVEARCAAIVQAAWQARETTVEEALEGAAGKVLSVSSTAKTELGWRLLAISISGTAENIEAKYGLPAAQAVSSPTE